MIPQAAPQWRIARFREEVTRNLLRVLDSNAYVLGEEVERFEEEFARYLGVAECVAVNSGTDALVLALRAAGVGPGDEVITVALTFAATAMAIRHCGAVPRFVDVDPVTRCLDPGLLAEAVTSRTTAVVPVHLHGHPADMHRLMDFAAAHYLTVVEDCAQAHGARHAGRFVGTFGQAGVFSFYPTKNLGCVGDGGAVVTNDYQLAGRLRSLRSYGWRGRPGVSHELGYNSRLDAIQAGVLRALLPHLDEHNRERAAIAAEYRRALRGSGVALPPDEPGAVYHQFAVETDHRDDVRRHLQEREGVLTGVHYDPPVHRQPAFEACPRGPLPVTEQLSRRMISLPIQPEVVQGRAGYIAGAVLRGLEVCKGS